jgi:hypothetical protein
VSSFCGTIQIQTKNNTAALIHMINPRGGTANIPPAILEAQGGEMRDPWL